jgi:single-strand DNA-binding protein
MYSVNKVSLLGRVGKDPETRQTGAANSVCNFSIATTEKYKDKSGEVKENTEWHNIVVWGKPAEIIQKYVKKGDLIYIEGKLQTRKWEDKEGNTRYSTEINAQEFMLMPNNRANGEVEKTTTAKDAPYNDINDGLPF